MAAQMPRVPNPRTWNRAELWIKCHMSSGREWLMLPELDLHHEECLVVLCDLWNIGSLQCSLTILLCSWAWPRLDFSWYVQLSSRLRPSQPYPTLSSISLNKLSPNPKPGCFIPHSKFNSLCTYLVKQSCVESCEEYGYAGYLFLQKAYNPVGELGM